MLVDLKSVAEPMTRAIDGSWLYCIGACGCEMRDKMMRPRAMYHHHFYCDLNGNSKTIAAILIAGTVGILS